MSLLLSVRTYIVCPQLKIRRGNRYFPYFSKILKTPPYLGFYCHCRPKLIEKGLGSRRAKICPVGKFDENSYKYMSTLDILKTNKNKFENQQLRLLWKLNTEHVVLFKFLILINFMATP